MLPPFSVGAKTAAKPVHRFQTFYVPNGMAMEYWTPKGEGTGFELSPILEPLAAYRNQMIVLSGIKANWNYIHAGASGSFLTGATQVVVDITSRFLFEQDAVAKSFGVRPLRVEKTVAGHTLEVPGRA